MHQSFKVASSISLLLAVSGVIAAPVSRSEDVVIIKVLGINDFHGQITNGQMIGDRPAGGADVLAAYLRNSERGVEKNTLVAMMGDQVGASVPESGLLNHEPSILFLNSLGNQSCKTTYRMSPDCNLVATVGNHEFDQGRKQLTNLIYGSHQPPTRNWISLPEYPGASFPYISANIVDSETGKLLFPPYVIKNVNGVKIAFIGAILKNAASSMLPENAKGLKFLDEAEAINSYIPEVKDKGADVVIAIMHQGGDSEPYEANTRSNVEVHGAIKNIVENLDDGVEVVMAGHTHRFLNAYLPNRNHHYVLVTQANSYSKAYAVVRLEYDKKHHMLMNRSAEIISTFADQFPGTRPDPETAYLVKKAENSVAPVVNAHIGAVADALTRVGNEAGESRLGDLIADAFKDTMHTDISLVNSASIRTDMKSGEVTWGELYAIQPFSNQIMKMEFKGRDILDILEQQWKTSYKNILQVSGIQYHYDDSKPVDYHVSDVTVNGVPLDVAKTYTVAVSSFLANGGSGFTVFKRGKILGHGGTDLELLVQYIRQLPEPFDVKLDGRIGRLA